MVRMIVVVAWSLAVLSSGAAAQEKQVTDDQYAELQKNFAEAYNRKDADAMAAAFTEDGIRVTPSGIFQGRDAIDSCWAGRPSQDHGRDSHHCRAWTVLRERSGKAA
jgi:ketosteroid isomerase-like protein